MKLNIGCGHAKREGYINVDACSALNPDLCLDVTKTPLPYEDLSIGHVTMFHTLEHTTRDKHAFVLAEINRVLKLGGTLYLSYPEAPKILQFYLDNKRGMREYWEKTILGRGTTLWDVHRSLISTRDLIPVLNELGFSEIKADEEFGQEHNTFLSALKTFSVLERSDLLRKEIV